MFGIGVTGMQAEFQISCLLSGTAINANQKFRPISSVCVVEGGRL